MRLWTTRRRMTSLSLTAISRPAALRGGKLDLSMEPWALALVEGRLTGKVLNPNEVDDEKQN